MMCVRTISNSILFVIFFIFVFAFPSSVPFVHADASDDPTTRPPTIKPTTPTLTPTPTTQTPTTRTPTTQVITQTQAPTTLAPTNTAATTLAQTVPPTTFPPTMIPCGNRGQCSTCTMDGQCSWCAETSTCVGVTQQNPTICTARGWRTVPSTCAAPMFNPILQPAQAQAAQLIQLGTINATNPFFWANNAPLQNIDPEQEFVYIQLNVLTQNAPRALIMHLFVVQQNGMSTEVVASTPTTRTSTTSFLTIRPTITRDRCTNNANAMGTCTFMLSVTSDDIKPNAAATALQGDTAMDFKLTFARGPLVTKLSTQVVDQIGNDSVALFGIDFPFPFLDVKISLIPDQNNPNTDLDLFVTNMNAANTPLFAGRQTGRGTNQQESFIINTAVFSQSGGGLYMISVVPAQIDTTRKLFTLDLIKNFKNEWTIALSTLGIIAAVAVLVLCFFSIIAVIAKRRRRALLAAQAAANQAAANVTASEPQGLTAQELELIPIHEFQKNSEAASDDSLCSICLCDYEVGQPVRTLACLHHFHTSCVDPWLKDHRTCPNCRKDAIEGLKASSSGKAASNSDAEAEAEVEVGPQVIVDRMASPAAAAPLPSPRGQIPSITYVGGGSGAGSHFSHSSPRSAASEHVITPMEVEAHFPHYAATQSTGSSSSSNSHPYPSYPSPSPHHASLSARRLSNPADLWQDAPNIPQQ